jgi:hypothetical protein
MEAMFGESQVHYLANRLGGYASPGCGLGNSVAKLCRMKVGSSHSG